MSPNGWLFFTNSDNKDSNWLALVNNIFGFKISNYSTKIVHQNALNTLQNDEPYCYLSLNQGFFIHSTLLKQFVNSSFYDEVKNIGLIERLYMFLVLNSYELRNTEIPFINIIDDISDFKADAIREYVNSFIPELFKLKDDSWKNWKLLKMTAISNYSRRNIIIDFNKYTHEELLIADIFFKKTIMPDILIEELYTISEYYYYFIFDDITNILENIQDIIEKFGKTRHVYITKMNEIQFLDNKFEIDMIGVKYNRFIINKMDQV
ncbi:MAG: hypothetical protein EBU66_15670 [Bacteroidetes bacterium]|nr:hypothetical protein [Bacteroidota bacterium]